VGHAALCLELVEGHIGAHAAKVAPPPNDARIRKKVPEFADRPSFARSGHQASGHPRERAEEVLHGETTPAAKQDVQVIPRIREPINAKLIAPSEPAKHSLDRRRVLLPAKPPALARPARSHDDVQRSAKIDRPSQLPLPQPYLSPMLGARRPAPELSKEGELPAHAMDVDPDPAETTSIYK
jgi:hypothetical protein